MKKATKMPKRLKNFYIQRYDKNGLRRFVPSQAVSVYYVFSADKNPPVPKHERVKFLISRFTD